MGFYMQAKDYEHQSELDGCEFYDPNGYDWIIGSVKNMCPEDSPDKNWVCTREKGHTGYHVAGTGPCHYAAYWTTHKVEGADFFGDLGL